MAIDFPNSPTVNQSFTAGGLTWTWDGVTWRSVGQPTPGRFLVSETAPSAPLTGDAWFKSSTGQTFVYYDSFWVETSVSPAGPPGAPGAYLVSATAPSGPSAGNAWFNTTDGRMYVWSGTEWFEPVSGLQGANGVYNFGETAPAAPAIGQGWVSTNTGKMYIWSGTEWFEPTNNGASASTVSLTGGSTIIPQTPSTVGLITKAAPGQTADLQQWQNLNGTVVAEVSADGSGFFSNNFAAGKNVIINGAFDIWQRGTSFSSSGYTADRWQPYLAQASKLVSSQSTTAPAGFKYSYLTTSSSAYTPLTGEYFMQTTRIEGFNTQQFAFGTSSAKNLTLSFWVRSSLTGLFGGAMHNNAFDRTFVFSYTVNAANTWEYKTISVPGDTAGTWDNTTAVGLEIGFSMGTTAALSTTAGSWVAGTFWGVTGQVNVVSTNGATWQVTGVQLEAGAVATPFSRAGGTLAGELAACQRYYARYTAVDAYGYLPGTMRASSTTSAFGWLGLPVTMRTSPTSIEYSGTSTLQAYGATASSIGSFTLAASSPAVGAYTATINGSGMTANTIYNLIGNNSATAYLAFNAEL